MKFLGNTYISNILKLMTYFLTLTMENYQFWINFFFNRYSLNRYQISSNNNCISDIRHICVTRSMRMFEYVLSILSKNVDVLLELREEIVIILCYQLSLRK